MKLVISTTCAALFFTFAGCTDDGGGAPTGGSSTGGSAGSSSASTSMTTNGSSGSPTSATSGSGGSGGAPTTSTSGAGGSSGGGGATGSGTAGAGGASGGSAGSSGGSGGAGGTGGMGGMPGDAGPDGSSGAKFTCPPGPFPRPMAGQATTVCAGFAYNYGYNEGPTWNPTLKAFFFSNFPQGKGMKGDIVKYTPGGSCEIFIRDVGCNGLGLAPSGNIMGACQQPRAIMEFDVVTKMPKVLADMYMGRMLDSPNDLVAHSNGSIYFSNPTFELDGRAPGVGASLFWRDPAGALTQVRTGGMNGVALSADEKTLYVVGAGAFEVDATGRPGTMRAFNTNGDGLAMDCGGNLYSSNGSITSPMNTNIGTVPAGTNLAFGGADGMTLLIVGRDTMVRTVQMNVPGFP